jgi:outer membrane immunogenic protein
MKKQLAATAILTALIATPALADRKPKTPQPPPPPPVFNWTGFYVGGFAGDAWGSSNPKTAVTSVPPGAEFVPIFYSLAGAAGNQSIKPGGFTGGIEAGYNWQFDRNYLAGIEGDFGAFELRGSANSGPVFYPAPATFTISSSANTTWLATLRGRLGVTADNWLFYATGGAAFTTLHGNFSFSESFYGAPAETASISSTKTGYAVGGGFEDAFWQHWSLKAEYLYVQFGTVTTTGIYGPPILVIPLPFGHSIDLKANIVRVGLNYHF